MTHRGIEILAKSIYRELCDRGCRRSDVIRLATALLDQLVARELEHRVVEINRAEQPGIAGASQSRSSIQISVLATATRGTR